MREVNSGGTQLIDSLTHERNKQRAHGRLQSVHGQRAPEVDPLLFEFLSFLVVLGLTYITC
jgi:hypothetical protein